MVHRGAMLRGLAGLLLALIVSAAAPGAVAPEARAQDEPRFRALLFTKTAAFRHDSIPAGVTAVQELAAANDFAVDRTEDSTQFNDANLASYDVVIWLNTTGDVLNPTEQGAFERYIQGGGGFAGVHSAADGEYEWEWYGGLVGAYFRSHPEIQPATIKVADRAHPATRDLPVRWTRTDEWYNFRANPRGRVHVLAALDETSYDPGSNAMGFDHPIAWCQDYDGGRSFYTGGGHTIESFSEPAFRQHLLAGIETAAGATPADCGATTSDGFEKVALDQNTSDPFELDVAQDGRVFFVERGGAVKVYKPATGSTVTAGRVSVYTGQENGLMGIALDPAFATNGWLYVFYAAPGTTPCPASDPGATACGLQHLSRFTVTGDTIAPASEEVLLSFPIQRDECCHSSGSMDFDAQGNLYLTTGDNANPHGASGYTPIDERGGRSSWDAQRTSANTNDLRGKILRIHPQPDGSYTVPAGNLFAPGTMGTRPEIYAMGLRNPFRMTVDQETGWVYVGDYGPDAVQEDPNRGPAGYVEWNQIRAAGNYGWPYCHGNDFAYNDYDFAAGTSGPKFDCASPRNDSPANTGLATLPPSQAPKVWYSYGTSAEFPELGTGCGCPMAGPVYHYDAALDSERKFPAYYDDTPFFFEWGRNVIKEFKQDAGGDLLDIYPFMQGESFIAPMDMTFGPDGAMYLLEWGSGFGGANSDSGLYRIDYIKGARRPIVRATATPDSGPVPLRVQFSSEGTRDPDSNDPLAYAWDFESDGTVDSTDPNPVHTYQQAGNHTARLTVTDATGKEGVANVAISAGNTRPQVRIDAPPDGGFFDFGDDIAYSVTATDAEDGRARCADVRMEYLLGHDLHGHPLSQQARCSGTVATASDTGHGGNVNLFGILEATYADTGAAGLSSRTGRAQAILQPKRKQAEHYTTQQGVQPEGTTDEGGGQAMGFVDPGDHLSFRPMNLRNITSIAYRVASGGAGGRIELRLDAPDGPLVATTTVQPTGGYQQWATVRTPVTDPGGTHDLFMVFQGSGTGLLNLNWIEFEGRGVSVNAAPRVEATGSPAVGVVPQAVQFAATGTDPEGRRLTYTWAFGDGTTGSGAQVTHTYQTAGVFTATVTATDPGGRFWTDTVSVRVRPQASPPLECADPAPDPAPDDEFDGDRLDGCRWSAVRPDYHGFRVKDGQLEIDTTPTELFGTQNDVPNLMLQDWPYDDWTAEAKIAAPLFEQWHQAGIIVYLSDATFLKFGLVAVSEPGANPPERKIEIRHEIGEVFQNDFPEVLVQRTPGDVYWLRLQKRGDEYRGFYSLDGVTYRELAPDPVVNRALGDARVGVYAFGSRTTDVTVGFDHFHLVESSAGDTTPPQTTATLDPAAPDGENGWYLSPVRVALAATDEGSGVASTEYRVDGGAWTAYTAPFTIAGDGDHAVEYRSTDAAGNVEDPRSIAVRIDRTAPAATCSATPNRLTPPDRTLRDVTVAVGISDATSGAGGFTLTGVTSNDPRTAAGDIAGWDVGTADTAGQLRATSRGSDRVYRIAYEARDRAGNTTSCEATVTAPRSP